MLSSGKPGYAAGTTGPKIVIIATVKENDLTGKLFIRVAKAGTTVGKLAALNNAELVQVQDYFAWIATESLVLKAHSFDYRL